LARNIVIGKESAQRFNGGGGQCATTKRRRKKLATTCQQIPYAHKRNDNDLKTPLTESIATGGVDRARQIPI
jgi:hypothetical protein